jgi:hypothetical protein
MTNSLHVGPSVSLPIHHDAGVEGKRYHFLMRGIFLISIRICSFLFAQLTPEASASYSYGGNLETEDEVKKERVLSGGKVLRNPASQVLINPFNQFIHR